MSKKTVSRVDLRSITVTHNPRCPARGLAEGMRKEGIEDSFIDLCHNLAFSEDDAKKAEFIRLVETYESGPNGLMELAASRLANELQPICLRSYRAKLAGSEEFVERYALIMGERRYLAAVYNYVKHNTCCNIGAMLMRVNSTEAYDLGVVENLQRMNMSDVEIGLIFREYADKGMSIKDIAERFHLDYQFVRGRLGLSYLSETEQQAVEEGRLGLTKAIDKGLEVKGGKSEKAETKEIEPKKAVRRKTRTLKEVEVQFDAVPRNNQLVLEILAWVMNLELTEALQESDSRLAEAVKVNNEGEVKVA